MVARSSLVPEDLASPDLAQDQVPRVARSSLVPEDLRITGGEGKFQPLELDRQPMDLDRTFLEVQFPTEDRAKWWFRAYQKTLKVRSAFFLLVCMVLTFAIVEAVLVQVSFRVFADLYEERVLWTWRPSELTEHDVVSPFLALPLSIIGGALLMQQFWHLFSDTFSRPILTKFSALVLVILARTCNMNMFRRLCVAVDVALILALEAWPLLNAFFAILGMDYGVRTPFLMEKMWQNYLIGVMVSSNMLACALFATKVAHHEALNSQIEDVRFILLSQTVYPGTLHCHYSALGNALYQTERPSSRGPSKAAYKSSKDFTLTRQERLASLNCWHVLAFIGSAGSTWMWGFPWPSKLYYATLAGSTGIIIVHAALGNDSSELSSVSLPLMIWLAISLGITMILQCYVEEAEGVSAVFLLWLALWPATCFMDFFRRRYFCPEKEPVQNYVHFAPLKMRLKFFCGIGAFFGGLASYLFQSWKVTLAGTLAGAQVVHMIHTKPLSNTSLLSCLLVLTWVISCGVICDQFARSFLITTMPSLVVGGSLICCMRQSLQVPDFIKLLFVDVLLFGFVPLILIGKAPDPSHRSPANQNEQLQTWLDRKVVVSAFQWLTALVLILSLASRTLSQRMPKLLGFMFWSCLCTFAFLFLSVGVSTPKLVEAFRQEPLPGLMDDAEDAAGSLPRSWAGVERHNQYPVCQRTWGAEGSALQALDLAALAWAAYEEDLSLLKTLLQRQFSGTFFSSTFDFTPDSADSSVHEWFAIDFHRIPRVLWAHFRPEDSEQYDRSTIVIAVKGSSTVADILFDTDLYCTVKILQFLELFCPVMELIPAPLLQALVRLGKSSNLESKVWTDLEGFVTKAMKSYPFADIVLTGHSLGGVLAATVGSKLKLPTLVWNAPGTLYLQEVLGLDPTGIQRMVVNVVADEDFVPLTDVQQCVVQPIPCIGKGGVRLSGMMCHSMLKTGCEIWRVCGDQKQRDFSEACGRWVGEDDLKGWKTSA